ncbi:putative aminophospholipid-translocase [Paramarasmius palmivorus]|uniref:Aminophospholipid-translocase n=1 Tax=Paramarasmius palmivorus TaxID=297713 RepID=A0AAW0BF71_9AGAR
MDLDITIGEHIGPLLSLLSIHSESLQKLKIHCAHRNDDVNESGCPVREAPTFPARLLKGDAPSLRHLSIIVPLASELWFQSISSVSQRLSSLTIHNCAESELHLPSLEEFVSCLSQASSLESLTLVGCLPHAVHIQPPTTLSTLPTLSSLTIKGARVQDISSLMAALALPALSSIFFICSLELREHRSHSTVVGAISRLVRSIPGRLRTGDTMQFGLFRTQDTEPDDYLRLRLGRLYRRGTADDSEDQDHIIHLRLEILFQTHMGSFDDDPLSPASLAVTNNLSLTKLKQLHIHGSIVGTKILEPILCLTPELESIYAINGCLTAVTAVLMSKMGAISLPHFQRLQIARQPFSNLVSLKDYLQWRKKKGLQLKELIIGRDCDDCYLALGSYVQDVVLLDPAILDIRTIEEFLDYGDEQSTETFLVAMLDIPLRRNKYQPDTEAGGTNINRRGQQQHGQLSLPHIGGQKRREQVPEPEPEPTSSVLRVTGKKQKDKSRTIPFRPTEKFQSRYPPNIVRNQKYNAFTFLPIVFYEQFKFFFNLYFLLVALSQFVPALKIGFIATYIAPLAFVLFVTMGKEAYDDYKRYLRDREANSQKYLVLEPPSSNTPNNHNHQSESSLLNDSYLDTHANTRAVPSSSLRVGHLIRLEKNQRLPTDLGIPMQNIPTVSPLTAENVLWANTVLAAGSVVGLVVYTGPETRAVMNTSHPETKVSLLGLEINNLAKILCAVTFALPLVLVALNGFRGLWYIYVFRFLILFSSIIPIRLGKTVYAQGIVNDPEIPGTIVRTSTLPEGLGRIEYLLSDKTGTLTQNEMEMRKLHMGTMSYGYDSMDEIKRQLGIAFGLGSNSHHKNQSVSMPGGAAPGGRGRRDMSSRVRDVVLSLALCHNVTPVTNDDGSVTYQVSSQTKSPLSNGHNPSGLTLTFRDRASLTLSTPTEATLHYEILDIFPFTSESKRMGIIVRETSSGEIQFLQKGADVVMAKIVQRNDWLEEECGNIAREGLRTLIVARKRLSASRSCWSFAKSLGNVPESLCKVSGLILGKLLALVSVIKGNI